MIQDLHSHTYYSFCGADTPEQVVETAIAGGIELVTGGGADIAVAEAGTYIIKLHANRNPYVIEVLKQ